jgi:endoribonuclease Dicer
MISIEPEFQAGEPVPTGDEAADEMASENFRLKSKVRTLLKEWTFTMPNLNPSSKSFNVTPKFAKLIQILQCFEAQGEEFRGLILGKFMSFREILASNLSRTRPVQKRSTAAAVADMLRTIGDQLPFLRPQTLVGQETRAEAVGAMDRATQHDVVEEFRTGKINLLVATRVAEDGVELPTCTCVIR